jgi:transposase
VSQLPPATSLWAQDETLIRLFPPLRKSWARRGQQAAVWLSGRNARRVIFGGLELHTGRRLFLVRARQQSSDFAQWLLLLRHLHGRSPLAVLLDENSSHTATANQALARRLELSLLWLPKRSPHLNPADHLWRWGKQHLSANRQEADIDSLARAFIQGLRLLTPEQALRRAGVLSSHFWLKPALSHLFCKDT